MNRTDAPHTAPPRLSPAPQPYDGDEGLILALAGLCASVGWLVKQVLA